MSMKHLAPYKFNDPDFFRWFPGILIKHFMLQANSIQKKRVQFQPNSKYKEEKEKEKLSKYMFFPSYPLTFISLNSYSTF